MTAAESQQQEQRVALTAYLGPLLQKHHQGDYITYEDLQASKRAADTVKGDVAKVRIKLVVVAMYEEDRIGGNRQGYDSHTATRLALFSCHFRFWDCSLQRQQTISTQ